MQRQEQLLRNWLKERIKLDNRADVPFPFARETVYWEGAESDVRVKFGASTIAPFIGVFATEVVRKSHVLSYPGIVMSMTEYKEMPFVVATACETDLGHWMEPDEIEVYSDDIVVVGWPKGAPANVMSNWGTKILPNVKLMEDQLAAYNVRPEPGIRHRIDVQDDYVYLKRTNVRVIRPGQELFTGPYSRDFFNDTPDHCDECFFQSTVYRHIYKCQQIGCSLQVCAMCAMKYWPDFDPNQRANRHDIMCRAHWTEKMNEEALEREVAEEEAAAAAAAVKPAVDDLADFAHDHAAFCNQPRNEFGISFTVWIKISAATWRRAFGAGATPADVTMLINRLTPTRKYRLQRPIRQEEDGSYTAIFWDGGPQTLIAPPDYPPVKGFEFTWTMRKR